MNAGAQIERPDLLAGRNSPPAIRQPALWQTFNFALRPERFFAGAHARHGDVFSVRLVQDSFTALGHPEAIKELFSYGPDDLNSGEPNRRPLRPVIGLSNLLLLDGEEHIHRRRMVLPAFHGDRMRAYADVIREATREQVASWPLDEPVAALPRMQELAFTIILRCIFGIEEQRLVEFGRALLDAVEWITDIRRVLFFFMAGPDALMRLPGYRRTFGAVDSQIYAELARRRQAPDLEWREDILSLLIQARDAEGEQLTDDELRDELLTLLIAGHETTATLLAWAIHELARDPASQARLASEGGAFSDAVVTEMLRLRPPLATVTRKLRRPLSVAGYEFPAGTVLLPVALLAQRRPDVYADPWAFKPGRFLDNRPAAGAWIPFGGSVRRCIGAAFAQFESKLVLEELLGALHLRPAVSRPEGSTRRAVALIPSRGAMVLAKRR